MNEILINKNTFIILIYHLLNLNRDVHTQLQFRREEKDFMQ